MIAVCSICFVYVVYCIIDYAYYGTLMFFVFFLMIRRPPRSTRTDTLFPYTTLFRSDGYARITGRPASTILHLGPGLGNGYANLHNAKRAGMPVVNLIGEHATFHRHYETPLASDINAVARPVSGWLKTAQTPEEAVRFATDAVQASLGLPPVSATLLLPGDTRSEKR